jgi:hypothetical protein
MKRDAASVTPADTLSVEINKDNQKGTQKVPFFVILAGITIPVINISSKRSANRFYSYRSASTG